ncbi:hypothetical protein [Bacillus sp. Marseille-P3661]|uniref:hypothetical protein n=1 Tax=Bacillus sp. Marseille-P3661 TaxID=1936234 RepID=UPI000C83E263|nr:hypothetical protein [Bacillus sp. Marseille-P3661]
MTLYHYIGADYPLTMGTFGESYALKKLSEVSKPDNPSDLRNILDLSHLDNEGVKVFETELDFAHVAITELRDPVLKDLLPINKNYIYELGGSFHLIQADKIGNFSFYQKNEKCVKELLLYLKRELKDGESIEIYSCWDSEEELPKAKEDSINLSSYQLQESFELNERLLVRIMKE